MSYKVSEQTVFHATLVFSSDKSAVMASPSEPGVHYLFGTDGDGRLLLHTIDLKEPGYGSAPGVVREGNVPIGGDYRYGRHKVVIEDPRHGYQLLTTRYVEEGAYTELVYFEVTEDGVQPAVALDTIHGHDRYGDGELQLDESASQLAYYNRAKYLGGFGYQQVELNLLSLSENRRAVTGKIKVPGASYGTSGKNSVEYYHVDGETYLFFNQEGLFRSETDAGYTKVLRSDPDGTLVEVDTEHFGDLRRGMDGRLYLASADAGGQIQYYDLSSNRFYPGDQETPATVSAPGSISYLPTQVFRQPEELESWHGRHVGAKRYELTDHLGNVHAVVSDRRIWKGAESVPEIYSMTDYYPFGSERNSSNSKEYRWNFQNQEKDSEWGVIVYKYRMYDPETGRFKSTDPLEPKYPWNSSYAFSENRVIDGVELEGLEWKATEDKEGNVTDYSWKGFEKDGDGNWRAPEGTVSGGSLGNYTLSSNAEMGTGTIERHSSFGNAQSGVVATFGSGKDYQSEGITYYGVNKYFSMPGFMGGSYTSQDDMVGWHVNNTGGAQASSIIRGLDAFYNDDIKQSTPPASGRADFDMAGQLMITPGMGAVFGATGNMAIGGISKIPISRLLGSKGITTADGFLFGGFTIKTPFNIPVQRFGNMSLGKPDFWGVRLGTSQFANRTFGAIKPAWNPLTQYTIGVIPKGTPVKFGIIGPQGWKYPGGSLQFIVPSRNVINQSSKLIR